MTQHTLDLPEVDLVYDVHGPPPTADGRPPLVMIGQPMDASGFRDQGRLFDDRTVVTYDPRGLGRSRRKDGLVTNEPETQAEDVHAIIEALGVGPVQLFASSGGGVTALALVTAHPNDVSTLVAHEPPIDCVLPDADAVQRAREAYTRVYQERGWGAGMAAFLAMTAWEGEVTDEYAAQPVPDPAAFGAHRARARRTARSAGDGLPQSPRWVHGRRVRLCGPARGVRRETARSARRRVTAHHR